MPYPNSDKIGNDSSNLEPRIKGASFTPPRVLAPCREDLGVPPSSPLLRLQSADNAGDGEKNGHCFAVRFPILLPSSTPVSFGVPGAKEIHRRSQTQSRRRSLQAHTQGWGEANMILVSLV